MLTALCLALLAAEPAAQARQPFTWEVPGLVEAAPVGDQLEARGLPLKVHLVRSKWHWEELHRHYLQRFTEAGYHVPRDQSPLAGLSLPRLTALDPEAMVSYTIIFYREQDKTTTMVLGAADMANRRGAQPPPFVPLFPGASKVVHVNVEVARSVTYRVEATPAEVEAFYRATLVPAGYVQESPTAFVGEAGRVRLSTRQDAKGLSVIVWLEHPGAD